jgi:hypothetical protein
MVTMKARELFERSAAPVEAPPKPGVKPGAPPVERPGAPPAPGKHPNPFRRRWTGPKPTPRPAKACAEALFNRDRAIKFGRAKPLSSDAANVKKAAQKEKTHAERFPKAMKPQRVGNAVNSSIYGESAKTLIRTLR